MKGNGNVTRRCEVWRGKWEKDREKCKKEKRREEDDIRIKYCATAFYVRIALWNGYDCLL